MTTTRELCRVLGAVLQVPGVEMHAARLVRDGLLPRAREEIEHHEAVILLLAVLGTADPNQASQTVERLAGLPRMHVSKSGLLGCWMPARDDEKVPFESTLPELVRDILGCLVEDVAGVRAGRITVARDDADVVVFVHSAGGFYRVTYGGPAAWPTGLRTFASISEHEIKALADLLKPDRPDALLLTAERATAPRPETERTAASLTVH